jgi:hypothetical protein
MKRAVAEQRHRHEARGRCARDRKLPKNASSSVVGFPLFRAKEGGCQSKINAFGFA